MPALPFTALPAHVWLSVATAIGIGISALVISTLLRGRFWKELIRDIGVAFIVAGVVSTIYEYSTRSIAERETLLNSINRAMSAVVPDVVWREVTDQILHRNAIRRNVEINARLSRDVVLPSGKMIHLPPNQGVLWISYGYDLYSLSASGSKVSVEHELDYEMWNDQLQLPRFDRVTVTDPSAGEKRDYAGKRLEAIYAGHGIITLDGANIVTLPPPRLGKGVRVVTERYELVNIPGAYNLVMQELAATSEKRTEPTIKVAITQVPNDIETDVTTYYPPHQFTKLIGVKNTWVFNNVLLPGQELTILFKLRSPASDDVGH